MSKLSKALFAAAKIIRKPVLLNRVIQDPDLWKEHVVKKYGMQEGLPVISPESLFGEGYSESVKIFTFLDGGSLVTDIALLRGLARKFKKCSYFEIGTWRGESVVNISDIAEECYSLNLSDEELKIMNVSDESIEQQAFFSKHIPGITHLKGNSNSFDFAGLNKKFDLIFIDGSHHYHEVKNDTIQVFKHLVHENSIVVWHDYGLTPEHTRFEVLAGILDGLGKDQHKLLYHVGFTKSAIFITESLKSKKLQAPVKPEGFYEVSIKYKSIEE